MENEERFVSVPAAGDYLGVTRCRAWKMIGEGKLPAQRVGKVYIVRFSDIADMDPPRRGRRGTP